jgi:hypothetical protein
MIDAFNNVDVVQTGCERLRAFGDEEPRRPGSDVTS